MNLSGNNPVESAIMTESKYIQSLLKIMLVAFATATFSIPCFAVVAGKAEFVVGNVEVVGAGGLSHALKKGQEVNTGEIIKTGTGRTQLRFTDGGQVSLAPDTEFGVDEYHYDGKIDGTEKGVFRLIKGGLRAITGAIGHVNKRNYLLNTPTATIGIRGTEYLATMHNKLRVRVGDGAVYVSNEFGDLVLYRGQSGSVEPGEKPKYSNEQPVFMAAGPLGAQPELQQQGSQNQFEQFTYILGQDVNSSGNSCMISGGCLALTPATVSNIVSNVAISDTWTSYLDSDSAWVGDIDYYFPNGVATVDLIVDNLGLKKAATTSNGVTSFFVANADVTRDSYGTNGGLSWSRWIGGSFSLDDGSSTPLAAEHLIWGAATPSSDITALASANNFVLEYSVSGYTVPTLTNTTTGVVASVPGAVTGTLFADFQYGDIQLDLTVGTAGNYIASGSFNNNNPTFNFIDGNVTAVGFFSGSNASQAGLTYKVDDGSTILQGAAAFNQTGANSTCLNC